MEYKLSPSDLTFLYDGCKHCFVLKVKHGISQPSIPIPGIFSIIASLQKDYYSDMRTEDFCPELPPGVVTHGEKWVRSKPINLEGCESTFYINGRFDVVATLDDGSYGILDFKTGNPNEEKTKMYSRQLHAYALALENPEGEALQLTPISKLGLLYFTPDTCEHTSANQQILKGDLSWIEVKRDDTSFNNFLRDAIQLLDGPLPPSEPDSCNWCAYKEKIGKISDLTEEGKTVTEIPKCPSCGGPMRLRTGKYREFWSCLKFPDCKGTRNH